MILRAHFLYLIFAITLILSSDAFSSKQTDNSMK